MRCSLACLCLLALPALAHASDPETDDAARMGQLAPDPDAPRDTVLPEQVDAARTCWSRAGRRRGAERTRVTVSFRVAANGAVRGARVVEPARPAPAARRCVLAALRGHRFPADEVARVLGDRPEAREVRHTFVLERVTARGDGSARVESLWNAMLGPATGNIGDVLAGGGVGGGGGLGVLGGARGPSVRAADPTVRGSLDTGVVRRVLQGTLPALRMCYERTRVRVPGLAGRLIAHLAVDARGHVSAATLGPEGPVDPALRACVTAGLQRASFPPPEGGGIVLVDFPLTFAP